MKKLRRKVIEKNLVDEDHNSRDKEESIVRVVKDKGLNQSVKWAKPIVQWIGWIWHCYGVSGTHSKLTTADEW